MLRRVSLVIRKIQSYKTKRKTLQTFTACKQIIDAFTPVKPLKKLLIIRLDDIGDYIIFRNFLQAYKLSAKWKQYEITLLGNAAWKNIFDAFDKDKVDKTTWIDKRRYFKDDDYRQSVWKDLHKQSFSVVINPSRTRPLLLDDMCALATGASTKIAAVNTFRCKEWNEASDILYTQLFFLQESYVHEFYFNKEFAEWCCDIKQNIHAPVFETIQKKINTDHFVFFIGAASESRRWPWSSWIELIHLFNTKYKNKIFITGGPTDVEAANKIAQHNNAENIAGKNSLVETIQLIADARLVITNNTMAAHAAVACKTPVIIIANGDNYFRATQYQSFNQENIITVYPNIFLKQFKKYSKSLIHYEAVSADIKTIKAASVFEAVKQILP